MRSGQEVILVTLVKAAAPPRIWSEGYGDTLPDAAVTNDLAIFKSEVAEGGDLLRSFLRERR